MTQLTIDSVPPGAEVKLDGEIIGTTPLTHTIGEPEPIDMLIFVSPQYKDDAAVSAAIQTYINAVKNDIGWNLAVVGIDQTDNQYTTIQTKINEVYSNNPLKACMMVGEDIAEENNVFHVSMNRMCQQALPFWQSLGGKLSPICPPKITLSENIVRVPISLIYPNFNDSYGVKSEQIITAMNKFSRDRGKVYSNNIIAFYDTQFHEVDDFGLIFEDELHHLGDDVREGDAPQSTVDLVTIGEYKLVIAAGHGRPDTVYVSGAAYSVFTYTTHGKNVKTPFLLVYGCSTSGWYTEINNDCLYQPPSNRQGWFGHGIFDNPEIRVILAGFPIGSYGENVEFVGSGRLSIMATGITIAEAMRGMASFGSNCTLFGDPTFHY